MKYIAIDIETTGLVPTSSQVLELAMVLEDAENIKPLDELPYFNILFRREKINGEFYAINMNQKIIKEAHDNGFEPDIAWDRAISWLEGHGFRPKFKEQAVAAGKNVGSFDIQFFPARARKYFDHRFLDPGSVFVDWKKDRLPGLADLTGQRVRHRAYEDALDVVRVLRKAYAP